MNWVSEIFKNVMVSKRLTGACCVTGLALLVTPTIYPEILEPLPKAWATAVLGITVFSACLQAFWGVSYLENVISNFVSYKAQQARINNLSEFELNLISQLGETVEQWSDLNNIDYSSVPFTKLKILEVCRMLRDIGLVEINSYHETQIRLSKAGRIKALEQQQNNSTEN
ncbi:hypothetical protein AB6C64_04265 [Vibrio cyclitrophicus]